MSLTLLFDSQGTLVDNYAISEVIEPYVFESHTANDIAADWRFQQKWAMFYTTLADAFVPLPELNKAALRWALDRHHVTLAEDDVEAIAGEYDRLRAYPEVLGALASLKEQGHTLKIVANPSIEMIRGHSAFAGTDRYLDEMISNGDEVRRFKPHPEVFQLGIERAGCPKEEILWVTGHFWEIVGAHRQGLRTAWINRARMPRLEIGVEATYATRNLQELADALAAESADGRPAVAASSSA
jgi:2-haloacid dehalogenase